MSDSGKTNTKKKVSLYTGKQNIGSDIVKKKGNRVYCYTVVKALKSRKCTKKDKEANMGKKTTTRKPKGKLIKTNNGPNLRVLPKGSLIQTTNGPNLRVL